MLVTLKVGCAPAHPWKVFGSPQPLWGGGGARGEVPFSGEHPYKLPLPWVIVVGLMEVVCGCVVHPVPKSGAGTSRVTATESRNCIWKKKSRPFSPLNPYYPSVGTFPIATTSLFPLVSRFHGPGRVPHSFVRTFFQLSPTVWFYVKSTLFCFLPGGICTPSVLCMVANAWTSLTQHSRPIEAKLTQPVFMLYRRCCIYLNVIRLSKFSLRWHYTLHISVLLHHPL